MKTAGVSCALLAAMTATAAEKTTVAPLPPTRSYFAYVCAESEDQVELVRFGPGGLEKVKVIPVGSFPADIEGPHGISVAPDGKHWYLSISHGLPFGSIHKYETGTDEWVGDVTVGMFPATLSISPSTGLLYVVNFDLYGDMKPSTMSVVETSTMTEVAQIPTGVMPHGARMDRKGTRVYTVNMMDDELFEIDALKFELARKLPLSGHAPSARGHQGHGTGSDGGKGDASAASPAHADLVQPTWVTPPSPQGMVYIAGNNKNLIFEVDLEKWAISRKFEDTADGPYNAETTPDGKLLVVTYKRGAAVGIWDLEAGKEVARIPTTRKVPHGIAVTPDGAYAFVSVEGMGGEPGAVEVYDLAKRERVAFTDVGKQAGGIALWKTQ